MPRRIPVRQLYNTTWIPSGEYDYDICCGCGLTHKVFYRFNEKTRRIEERWIVVKSIKGKSPHAKAKVSSRKPAARKGRR